MAAAPQDEASRVKLEAWLVTDVGVVREHNEDSAYMEPTRGFFIVADGMGGHAAGEVASAMAVDTVRKTLESHRKEIESFKRAPTDTGRRSIVQLLQSAVLSAHQACTSPCRFGAPAGPSVRAAVPADRITYARGGRKTCQPLLTLRCPSKSSRERK